MFISSSLYLVSSSSGYLTVFKWLWISYENISSFLPCQLEHSENKNNEDVYQEYKQKYRSYNDHVRIIVFTYGTLCCLRRLSQNRSRMLDQTRLHTSNAPELQRHIRIAFVLFCGSLRQRDLLTRWSCRGKRLRSWRRESESRASWCTSRSSQTP
jgi:hypothetical protein